MTTAGTGHPTATATTTENGTKTEALTATARATGRQGPTATTSGRPKRSVSATDARIANVIRTESATAIARAILIGRRSEMVRTVAAVAAVVAKAVAGEAGVEEDVRDGAATQIHTLLVAIGR